MAKRSSSNSRRNFLKTAGTVGVGSLLSPLEILTDAQAKSYNNASQPKMVPTRPFGKTGVDVPILCLGSAFGRSSDLLLKQAINMGVRLWDTAAIYVGGNSEEAIGKYFLKFPEDRKKIFLVTKSHAMNTSSWSIHLDRSLERMNTPYIDLYLIHGVFSFDYYFRPYEKAKF